MLQIIGLFFPAFLSLAVYDSLSAKQAKQSAWDHVKYYGMFTMLDVVTAILAIRIVKPGIIFSDGMNLNADFLCVASFIVLVVAAIFWGYCVKLLEGHFQIKIDSVADDASCGE